MLKLKRHWHWLVTASALTSSIVCGEVPVEKYHVYSVTSEFPPLQYQAPESGIEAKGYVAHLVSELHRRVARSTSISASAVRFLPWNRALSTAEREANTLFFSISRTPEREAKFKWVGEVSPYGQVIYSLKLNPALQVQNWQELQQSSGVIAVQNGSNLHRLLTDKSVSAKRIELVPDYHLSIRMLYADHVQYVPLTFFLARGAVCEQGLDPDQLQANFLIDELANPLWLAFSPNTSDELVALYRRALSDIKASGEYDALVHQEIAYWEQQACQHSTTTSESP